MAPKIEAEMEKGTRKKQYWMQRTMKWRKILQFLLLPLSSKFCSFFSKNGKLINNHQIAIQMNSMQTSLTSQSTSMEPSHYKGV